MRKLELLAPAADKHVAFEAILHGADAVYIGASSHGARKGASNSLADIAEVVKFAHQYRVRVYVTVNTLVYDSEIPEVESLINALYNCGVDAIIVQDMGILRMNIPPIELHASTQCDTRSVAKAQFLEKAGFSQIVLARELSIEEIKDICGNVSVPVECFIHGALCVCYSGRCCASQMQYGRSANRGECAQMCRLPYNLIDNDGKILIKNKYLLSLKDFNASNKLLDLIQAGVTSFKIEGRLKDVAYVKNVTAYYRELIDGIISVYPDLYCRSSFGTSEVSFIPEPEKSFNRGFTSYFLEGRRQKSMASLFTPKSMGERIDDVCDLKNGDGISFINGKGEYEGVRVNRIDNGRIIGARPFKLPQGCEIRRTFNREWQTSLERQTAKRFIEVDIIIDESGITASDERGVRVRIPLETDKLKADKRMDPEKILGKLGNTVYRLRNFKNSLNMDTFIPASQLTSMKRKLIEALDIANETTYRYRYRNAESFPVQYLSERLYADENVANHLAKDFYRSHGAETEAMAIEVDGAAKGDIVIMNTRYCIRRELGICKKDKIHQRFENAREPFYLESGNIRMRLEFDCSICEMRVIKPY